MEVYSSEGLGGSPELKNLEDVLREWRREGPRPGKGFRDFECEVRSAVMALERRVVQAGLQSLDVTAEQIQVDGVVLYKAYNKPFVAEYTCLAGEIKVARHLFRRVDGSGKATCPLELRAGIVESTWTPQAAERMCQTVAVTTPYEAEVLIAGFGGMRPSRSSLDRLPERMSTRWEERREEFERCVRHLETVPEQASTVAVSLDGVMVPVREAKSNGAAGKNAKIGYQEASCGTVSVHDNDGVRLGTVFFGRMPESKKPSLHRSLAAETADTVISLEAPRRLVFVADGASENWRITDEILSELEATGHLHDAKVFRIVDFWHACEHMKEALDAAYGTGSALARAEHERLKIWLRDERNGVGRVIRELKRLRRNCSGEGRKEITSQIGYFDKRREQMNYFEFQEQNLPIGSGVVEAACKTLVTQRLKRSGMSWSRPGGQGILTLRSLLLSGRWSVAWVLLAGSYESEVYRIRTHEHLTSIENLGMAS